MPRFNRLIIPDVPMHVLHRGVRRQPIFFREEDYRLYTELVAEAFKEHDCECWAYCWMTNHIHMMAVSKSDGLSDAMRDAHKRYAEIINEREGWKGHLWQGRYKSILLDGRHLFSCPRYIELNPQAAGLVESPEQWPWSSARAHLSGQDDGLVKVKPLLDMFPDWAEYLGMPVAADEAEHFESSSGRPVGSPAFLESLQARSGRILVPGKVGRPAKTLMALE